MSASFATRGLLLTEHEFSVPLDHSRPGRRADHRLRARGRRLRRARPADARLPAGRARAARRRARPATRARPGWLDRALHEFRVLMLDQRGTGRSSPIGALPGLTGREQAERLAHYRADAIVRDAEHIRRELGIEQWSLLGPELRRAVRDELPVDRARGPARGVGDRRPGAARAARSTTSTARPTRARSSAAGATTSATRATATASSRCASACEAQDVRLPVGRPADRRGACSSSAACWA